MVRTQSMIEPKFNLEGQGTWQSDEPVAEQEAWQREIRLPKHLLPLHYELYLHPDLGEFVPSKDNTIQEHDMTYRYSVRNRSFSCVCNTPNCIQCDCQLAFITTFTIPLIVN